jgi:hypothetical protein
MTELIVIIFVGVVVLGTVSSILYKVFKIAATKEIKEDMQVTSTFDSPRSGPSTRVPLLYPNKENLRPRPDIKPRPQSAPPPPRFGGSGNVKLVIDNETFDRILKESPNEIETIKELLREYNRRK